MSADLALVRSNDPNTIDLGVGEPYFLQKVYGHLYPRMFDGKVTYPPFAGDADLLRALKPYTRDFGEHVVIANGAKQALLAGIYALQKKYPGRYDTLTHQAPHWLSYPTMAQLSGLDFLALCRGEKAESFLSVVTSPNNPDGEIDDGRFVYDIWDAAYHSRVYTGKTPYEMKTDSPTCQLSVWSAAKLWGLSGYRIGWVATWDEELARYAAEYVEKTTSGVSVLAQRYLFNFLSSLAATRVGTEESLIFQARRIMDTNVDHFFDLHHMFSEMWGAAAVSSSGMFAWCKATDPERLTKVLDAARIKFIPGKLCGAEEAWFRFNMGVLPATMEKAIKAIKKEL